MSRILLTGAGGFLGSVVLKKLSENGHQVLALLSRPQADRLKAVEGKYTPLVGRLEAIHEWSPALRAFGPQAVIHTAWAGLHAAERMDPAQHRNVEQALALQVASAQAGARFFVGLGSQAEFGPLHGPADEEHPRRPDTAYGMAKVAAWAGLQAAAPSLGQKVAWARIFSCYGPASDRRWVLPSVALQLLKAQRPSLGACALPWDFLYSGDAAAAIVAMLEEELQGDYNLGSGEAPVLRTTLERLRDLVDPGLPMGFGERPASPGGSTHLQAVTRKLQAATNWAPQVDLERGLKEMLLDLRSGPL